MSKRDSAVIARGAEAATENEEETARKEREREGDGGWRRRSEEGNKLQDRLSGGVIN